MKIYHVAIEERITGEFMIMAEDKYDAVNRVKDKYRNGELILEPGELQSSYVSIAEPGKDFLNWEEI